MEQDLVRAQHQLREGFGVVFAKVEGDKFAVVKEVDTPEGIDYVVQVGFLFGTYKGLPVFEHEAELDLTVDSFEVAKDEAEGWCA